MIQFFKTILLCLKIFLIYDHGNFNDLVENLDIKLFRKNLIFMYGAFFFLSFSSTTRSHGGN